MNPPNVSISPMTAADYGEVFALWQTALSSRLDHHDSAAAVARYLARNPGCSFVAREGTRIVGAVLGGHDGRRGYLHHLAVASDCRRRGIGSALVRSCLRALSGEGIEKTHVFVQNSNPSAVAYWHHVQWQQRDDLTVYSGTHVAEDRPDLTNTLDMMEPGKDTKRDDIWAPRTEE